MRPPRSYSRSSIMIWCLFYSLMPLTSTSAFFIPNFHDTRSVACISPLRLSSTSPSISVESGFESIDPLLANVLLDGSLSLSSVFQSSKGMAIWRRALAKGLLPSKSDFNNAAMNVWPTEPLFSHVSSVMMEMQLPRFVLCHPETASAVLLSLLQIVLDFQNVCLEEQQKDEDLTQEEGLNQQAERTLPFDFVDITNFEVEVSQVSGFANQSTEELINAIASDAASAFLNQWSGAVSGVTLLDQIFGFDHGLLDAGDQGFGLQDGIWQHTGWKAIPHLQHQIESMPELRALMKELGRRPTAESSDGFQKFKSRKTNVDGGMGAQFDPQQRNLVSGLTLSGSLTEMLPSEAMLLRGSPGLRRLFFAKKVEHKLLSYQLSGWLDVSSIPYQTRPLRRMPSAPGGPIVVCLDTSWSMRGLREQLSKAVVLACVSAAHKQHRDCQIVAFSTQEGNMKSGIITPDTAGIVRLLDFLSHSFGGGTDVTGALKHAVSMLGSGVMSSADILMVTDGEIPDPPVSDAIMDALDLLKQQTNMEIHGLLVGKSESKPLSQLCTKTHDFLSRYDMLADLRSKYATLDSTSKLSPSSLSSEALSPTGGLRLKQRECGALVSTFGFKRGTYLSLLRRNRFFSGRALWAMYQDESDFGAKRIQSKKFRLQKTKRRNLNGDDYDVDQSWNGDDFDKTWNGDTIDRDDGLIASFSEGRGYAALANDAIARLKSSAENSLKEEDLDKESDVEVSYWNYHRDFQDAMQMIGEGLVERDEESQLVVLAMVAQEHILLLGVPGTGKSILGQRLAKLCGGEFFQRLLTRFTTPEEIFGPLSLRALENDEYRRCTNGFLPTASVAFLDEIFKANSAILNTLLTILNERKFDNGAGQQEICPIRCVVGASNELPESDELDALYDRFLLRKEVNPVSNEGVLKLLSMPSPGISSTHFNKKNINQIDDKMLRTISEAAEAVVVGDEICMLIRDLRIFMREELSVEVSDRRLVKAAKLLKVSAISNGRDRVDLIDCLLLQHLMWHLPEQRVIVREWLWDNLTPGETRTGDITSGTTSRFRLLLNGLRTEASRIVRKTTGDISGNLGGRVADIALVQSLHTEIGHIVIIMKKHQADLSRHMKLLHHADDHLWLNIDEALALKQQLLPRIMSISRQTKELLVDAISLQMCLSDEEDISNDLRLSIIDGLWEEDFALEYIFTEKDLSISMKEAKVKYNVDTFRRWKRERKRAQKQ